MPWEQTSAMDQRVQFIADWLSDDYTKMDLCRAYGISRPTADKWIQRYQQGGVEQLEERSRAAHCHPNQTSEEIRQMLIDTKLYRQSWGPKKVLDYLRENGPELVWPADSTAGEILKRVGLVKRRVRHHHVSPYSEPFGDCQGPNQIWSADFKGDFALGNHRRCYPLTLSDNFSRYLLLCRALEHPSYQAVRPWLEWAFREYGLPEAIRTDNGAPFASLAIGGVSCRSGGFSWASAPSGSNRESPARTDVMNGCIEPLSRMSRHSQRTGANRTVLIFSWSSITGSVLMKRWDERLRRVFIVPRHVLTQEEFQLLSTVPAPRFDACATTARSSGTAISFTSRRSWPKSRWDSGRSRKRNGRFVIVFICSVRSINEQKRYCQLKSGTKLTAKNCKPCARFKT
jgi:transposase InsO family protein